jgi:arginase
MVGLVWRFGRWLDWAARTYDPAMARVSVIGVPSSAGSYAAGQERARAAGLIDALRSYGVSVFDAGDLPEQVWRPDRQNPLAQNLDEVVAGLRELTERLGPLFGQGDTVLVLGGNCTIALAVVAALRRGGRESPRLLYFDRSYDMNTPKSTTDGALDWMGMAHALALPGSADALLDAFDYRLLVEPEQVCWLGVEPAMATEWEGEQAVRLGLRAITSQAVVADPAGSAAVALDGLRGGPLAVHFDVDVLDFTDAPLAENTDGRNTGPSLEEAALALTTAARDPGFRALSIAELNPGRSVGDPEAIPRFIDVIARTFATAK